MALGDWHAYVDPIHDFGHVVAVSLGREISRGQWEVVHGPLISEIVNKESGVSIHSQHLIELPPDAAKALYHALDRVYGHVNQDGAVEALKDSLKVERARVDKALDKALR